MKEPDPDIDEDPDVAKDKDLVSSKKDLSSFNREGTRMEKHSMLNKKAMYPFTVHAYDFKPGDWVKAILSEVTLSSYAGKVIDILPKANKVVVKWPHKARQEDPEWLVKLNKDESGIAVTSAHTVLRNSCRLAQNLVRIAQGLRKEAGISDVAAFLKMKQAFGHEYPVSWIKGAVEVAWPKRTASYSEEAQTVRSLYRYAKDLDAIEEGTQQKTSREFDPMEREVWEDSYLSPESDPATESLLKDTQEKVDPETRKLLQELEGETLLDLNQDDMSAYDLDWDPGMERDSSKQARLPDSYEFAPDVFEEDIGGDWGKKKKRRRKRIPALYEDDPIDRMTRDMDERLIEQLRDRGFGDGGYEE